MLASCKIASVYSDVFTFLPQNDCASAKMSWRTGVDDDTNLFYEPDDDDDEMMMRENAAPIVLYLYCNTSTRGVLRPTLRTCSLQVQVQYVQYDVPYSYSR